MTFEREIHPWVTHALSAVGGRIKSQPTDFVVEELPLYEPCGSGEHVYVRHRRASRTTREVQTDFARRFGLPLHAVGVAGQKDKVALATQTFSLHVPRMEDSEVHARLAEFDGEVLDVRRHANKLRVGHSRGNRFTIVLADAHDLGAARAIAAELVRLGLPNFYGEQRFGHDDSHVADGRRALERGERGWRARLQISALQAAIFDRWLAERIARGDFARLIAGDIAKRSADGAMFSVEDLEAESERFARREIVATGPIFGSKMRAATGVAGGFEHSVLESSGLSALSFAQVDAPGSRRAARLDPAAIHVDEHPRGLVLRFDLPKGAYATMVMREFTRAKADALLPADSPNDPDE